MEAALSAFPKPSTYNEILNYINVTWENQLSYLEVLKKDQRDKIAKESLQFLQKIAIQATPENISQLVVGCGILFRSYLHDLSPLFPLFDTLFIANRECDMLAAVKLISHISALTDEINPVFAKRYIQKACDLINSNKQKDMKYGLLVIQEFLQKIPSLILLYFSNIPGVLWVSILSNFDSNRRMSISILSTYIGELAKSPSTFRQNTFQSLYQSSLKLLTDINPKNQHSGILVIAALISYKGNFFEDDAPKIFNELFPFVQSENFTLRLSALSTLVHITKVNLNFFKTNVFGILFSSLMELAADRDGIVHTIDTIIVIIDLVSDLIYDKLQTIIELLLKITPETKENSQERIISLLLKILELDYKLLDMPNDIIWTLLETNTLSHEFVLFFKRMKDYYPDFETKHQESLYKIVINVLSSSRNPCHEALELISLLQITPEFARQILPLIKTSFFSKIEAHRIAAPKALIHIIAADPDNILEDSVDIFQLGICDFSAAVRRAVVQCFDDDENLAFLSTSNLGKNITILSKDRNFEVRTLYYNLLGRLSSLCPIMVQSTLREALASTDIALRTSSTLSEKVVITKPLPALISASSNIRTYDATLLPTIVDMITFSGNDDRIFLELELQLMVSLLQSLKSFAVISFDIIKPYFDAIRTAVIRILAGNNRNMKEAVIDLLETIVRSSPSLHDLYPYLSPILPVVLSAVGASTIQSFRVQALKFIGELGAISPMRIGTLVAEDNSDSFFYDPTKMKKKEHWCAMFGEIIFNKLLLMVEDKAFILHRHDIFQTAISIVGVLTTIPNKSFEVLMNNILASIEEGSENDRKNAIMQLHNLILIAKQRVCPYVPKIMRVIDSSWNQAYLEATLTVVMTLVIEVHTDFSDFVAPLVPRILEALSASTVGHPEIAKICLPVLAFLGPSYANAVALIFPQICLVINLETTPRDVLIIALTSLRYLVQTGDPSFHATAIFSSVIDLVAPSTDQEIRSIAVDVLFSLMIRIGESIIIYAHRIIDALGNDSALQEEFEEIMDVISNVTITEIANFPFISMDPPIKLTPVIPEAKEFNIKEFEKTFSTNDIESPKHWNTWLVNTILVWVNNSPSPAVSLLHDIVATIPEFIDFVIFPAFFSCWYFIGQRDRQKISRKLLDVMNNSNIPDEILMKLLRLCEMMDKVEEPIAVSQNSIFDLCLKVHYNSYAIHISQVEFFKNNNKTYAHSAATLLVESGKSSAAETIFNMYPIDNQKQLLFRLGRWQQALELFSESLQEDPLNTESFIGFVTCARNMKKYSLIFQKEGVLQHISRPAVKQCAISFALAFFMKGDYEKMYNYAKMADTEQLEAQIILSLSSLLTNRFQESEKWSEISFNTIAQQKRTLFSIGYSDAYSLTVYCQVLWEIHEYSEKKGNIDKKIWRERMMSVNQDTDSWLYPILLRIAKLPEETDTFYQFLNMSLQERKFGIFESYVGVLKSNTPKLALMRLKFHWAAGKRDEAMQGITKLINSSDSSDEAAVAYFDWKFALKHDETTLLDIANKIKQFMGTYSLEIYLRWGLINYHLSRRYPENYSFAVEAIRGFVPVIRNTTTPQFSSIAQMLFLFFSIANNPAAYKETEGLIRSIESEKLIEAIPQLVGQLGHSNQMAAALVQNIILQLSSDNSRKFILFPLIVATQTINTAMREKAQNILQNIAYMHSKEVVQSFKLSSMLIYASQTLFEMWTNYSDERVQYLLERAHNPQCPMDRLFARTMFTQLRKIDENIREGKDSSDEVNEIISLSAQKVAETDRLRLVDISDERNYEWSEIDIPGAMSVKIESIQPNLDVLNSKQHPRRLVIVGTDGNMYTFLLKSNEDLGLDQRVMQYFKLVNLFVKSDYMLNSLNTILRDYAIVPMSPQVGLIQWVEGSDTISHLIEEYRRSHDLDPLIERHIMETLTITKIDSLLPIQRHELLAIISAGTPNDDLRTLMWLKSPSADHWLVRNLHLQRSAAINSIVGYTLGLGDRHASNIMIDRKTGDMIHIDFGDCFEVNYDRVLYPEKIPFRLTRMLVAAFGIGGVDTEFRNESERVFSVIRDNASSLASVLELFLLEGNYTTLEEGMIKRTWDKMSGDDFEGQKCISPTQQVELLIEAATDQYNLSCLYSGWAPLW